MEIPVPAPPCTDNRLQHLWPEEIELSDNLGNKVEGLDPIREAAELLDAGRILAMRGVGGFHLACIEESADELKRRLGRIEQPFAIMVRPDYLDWQPFLGRINESWKARFILLLS